MSTSAILTLPMAPTDAAHHGDAHHAQFKNERDASLFVLRLGWS
jgi:hypothetical protein